MRIIITENTAGIEPGIYTIKQLAEMMQCIVDAIKNGERV